MNARHPWFDKLTMDASNLLPKEVNRSTGYVDSPLRV